MFSSSSAFKEVPITNFLQHQSSYEANSYINDTIASYGVESFDLSLLGSDFFLDNFQQKYADEQTPQSNLALTIEINSHPSYQKFMKQEDSWQQSNFNLESTLLLSPVSSQNSPSPCPSVEFTTIKQEQNILLPPSPPDSISVPSPLCDSYKIEQFDEHTFSNQSDLTTNCNESSQADFKYCSEFNSQQKHRDHQVLREFLQDTSFQRKHNLRPLGLDSIFGGLTQQGDIEPVISLALQHAKKEIEVTCASLSISPDPQQWTQQQVQLWIQYTVKQFKLDPIESCELAFAENGKELAVLGDEEFARRAPQIGSILHAQLEIWKAAFVDSTHSDNTQLTSSVAGPSSANTNSTTAANSSLSQTSLWNQMLIDSSDLSEDDSETQQMELDVNLPEKVEQSKASPKAKTPKKHHSHLQKKGAQSSHIHLWQFLKELLASPQVNGTAIRWLDRTKGIFKIEDSVKVAKLWGRRKNRPAMNYDKLSRSIRQYYKKGIMKKTERSQRLVYQFCHPYSL